MGLPARNIVRIAASSIRGLECRVANKRFVIPLDEVQQLIDYQRSPLPLAKGGVAGIGVVDGEPLVSLTLDRNSACKLATVKGALLQSRSRGLRFALEVDEAFSFLDVQAQHSSQVADQAAWLIPGTLVDGTGIEVLRVRTLFSALGVEVDS